MVRRSPRLRNSIYFGQIEEQPRRAVSELEQHYPGVPVALTPNGVDIDRFRPDPSVRSQVEVRNGPETR